MKEEEDEFRYKIGSKHCLGVRFYGPQVEPDGNFEWTIVDKASVQKRGGYSNFEYNCAYKLECEIEGETYVTDSMNDGFVKETYLDMAIEAAKEGGEYGWLAARLKKSGE
nr:hypothetical protein [Sicyoidochytrium minutum DNA virus]